MDVYHGLSNELPKRIDHFKGAKVVTIHDVILRYTPMTILDLTATPMIDGP